MLTDRDGDADNIDGTEDVATAVLFEEIVGNPEEGDPLNELLLDEIVGRLDEAELVGNAVNELFTETVGNPEEAVEI